MCRKAELPQKRSIYAVVRRVCAYRNKKEEYMDEEIRSESEFGQGFTYCLALFLMHVNMEIVNELRKPNGILNDWSIWFNGAADHLYEMEIPENLPEELKGKCEGFRDQCIDWRLTLATKEDYNWAIEKALEILREYDIFTGVKSVKAQWQ
jgi:hypothetical protein